MSAPENEIHLNNGFHLQHPEDSPELVFHIKPSIRYTESYVWDEDASRGLDQINQILANYYIPPA